MSGSRTGAITVTDNAGDSPQTVALTGTGLGGVANVSPTSLTFTAQLAESTSTAKPLTLSNTGGGSLTLTSIVASGDFAQTNNCGASLAVNANCTINVTFKPTAAGSRTGAITLMDNAADSPQTVSLSGTGEDFSFAPAAGSATSSTVSAGQGTTYTISIGGEGGLAGTVNFACTGAPSESTCTVSPNPMTVGSSAANVTVTVTTTAATLAAPRSRPLPPAPPYSPDLRQILMLILALALMAWVHALAKRHSLRRWRFSLVPLAAGIALAMALIGCGGGGGGGGGGTVHDPGTPAGNYTLTVTGTAGSGTATMSHTVKLTLKVS